MLLAGGVLLLAGVWLVVTGLLARDQLQHVRAEVHRLHGELAVGDLAAARATAADLARHARFAHQLTTGPAWALVADLPGGGEPIRTLRAITAQIDALGTDTLPQLVSARTALDPRTLRRPDGSIDLRPLIAARPALDRASAQLASATATIRRQSGDTWLGSIDDARRSLLDQLGTLGAEVSGADLAARIVPPMLGADGPRRYLMAFQNEAEARGTGGIPGAFAIVRADRGRLTFERFEPDDTLGTVPTGLWFGPGYSQLFRGARTTSLYVNTNLSPHFPYAARLWLAMWRAHSGERLAGAIALDPTVLSYLLAVTGPAPLPDGSVLTAQNVVDRTEREIYARFPGNGDIAARKAYLLTVARAATRTVLHTRVSLTALLRAAGRAIGERRLLLYSSDHRLQSLLLRTPLAGAVVDTARPYVGLSIVNDGGNKLDYYLDRSLSWRRTGCGSTRDVTVTVRLANTAPASGLSHYVTSRSDRRAYHTEPGDNRLLVSYYATRGAQLSGVEVDGVPGTASAGADLGHPVYTVDLELPRGTTRTIVLQLREPAGAAPPYVLRQPLVRPLHVSLDDARCG
jgi:hypothetical protein